MDCGIIIARKGAFVKGQNADILFFRKSRQVFTKNCVRLLGFFVELLYNQSVSIWKKVFLGNKKGEAI